MKGEPSNQPQPGGALQRFLKGFVYAGKGICSFKRSERTLPLPGHSGCHGSGFLLRHQPRQIDCRGAVLRHGAGRRRFNSAIWTPGQPGLTRAKPSCRWHKDVAAGAVLVCAIAAAVVGLIIFCPIDTVNQSDHWHVKPLKPWKALIIDTGLLAASTLRITACAKQGKKTHLRGQQHPVVQLPAAQWEETPAAGQRPVGHDARRWRGARTHRAQTTSTCGAVPRPTIAIPSCSYLPAISTTAFSG